MRLPTISCVLALLPLWGLGPIACDGANTKAPAAAVGADADDAEVAKADPPAKSETLAKTEAPTPEAEAADDDAAEDAADDPPDPPPVVLEPKTVLIVGSSMVATGFGALLEKSLDAHPLVTCHREAKSATGLARPDFFDWMDVGRRQIALHHPDLVVVLVGGNDGQDLQTVGKGKHVVFRSEAWEPAYRQRVDEFLAMLTSDGAEVLWLGVPRTNTVKLEAKLDIIRDIQKAAVAEVEGATYLSLTPYLEGEGGELMREALVNGKYQTLRGDDGLHLTMSGSRYLADKVMPEVLAAIDMPPADELPKADADPKADTDPKADDAPTPATDDAP